MFTKILIANRGEIALRVIRACRDLGIATVAVHSDVDAKAPFAQFADEAVAIGGAAPSDSYLVIDRIIDAAKKTGAEAIHPGYGFLSENRAFAQACADAGITFIGPPPSAMEAMAEKIAARKAVAAAHVPIVPGTDELIAYEDAAAAVETIGFPILLKASAGGGGIGMKVVHEMKDLQGAFETAQSTAQRAFGNPAVFIEKYVQEPRHIEIQILADAYGNTVYCGERECSIQRRHQKIVEEAPSPAVTPKLRQQMGDAAVAAAKAVGYVNAGTVEFIFSQGDFYFLEMNTRLQVEHPITEAITGIDLVVEQIRIAAGEKLRFSQDDIVLRGHAIEARVNAENPLKNFMPSPGRVTKYREPGGPGVRVDSALIGPATIPQYYDPMVAKVIVWGEDRQQAIGRMRRALLEYVVKGVFTNIPYHLGLLESPDFCAGKLSTHFIADHSEILERVPYWIEQRDKFSKIGTDEAYVAAIAAAAAVTLS